MSEVDGLCCFLADLASFDPPVMKGLDELLAVSLKLNLQPMLCRSDAFTTSDTKMVLCNGYFC